MIPKKCKRLAEVDFPIAVVSKHSAREKSIRHGHPSTLHLWWARRPLAACRAMLMALLLPDPCDEHCPEDFKNKARELLSRVPGYVGPDDLSLRKALLKFIGDFANWDLSTDQTYLEVGRGLVRAAYPGEPPLVVDPFAGGGSIPLEALRLGCEAFASDLNPVACLILKVLIEDIPRYGPELAEELRKAGKKIKEEAERELAKFYPPDPDGSRPIAYLWARTVRCEAPNCGAEIPLMRSFWLCKKPNRKRALRYRVIRSKGQAPQVEFEIFEPKSDEEVPAGTVTRARATCLCCGTVLPPERVRAQLAEQRGGADVVFDERGKRVGGARLMAIVTVRNGGHGRYYRLPIPNDYLPIYRSQQKLSKKKNIKVPFEPLPSPINKNNLGDTAYFNFIPAKLYGMKNWGDLFSSRQKLGLGILSSKVREISTESDKISAIKELFALAIGRTADQMSSLVRWLQTIEAVASTFGRQALPIVWDFVEIVPIGIEGANFYSAIEWIVKVIQTLSSLSLKSGQCQQADARIAILPEESCNVWFTDPPYYDAVPYAALSDYFFVWFKRILPNHPLLKDPFNPQNPLTPKIQEIIDDLQLLRGVPKNKAKSLGFYVKDREYFENSMYQAFTVGRKILRIDGIGCVIFAHKTTEGWEALLSGLLRAGMVITASWPITTERVVRMRARDSAALTASVHLVCRPRPENAPVGDWADVLRELPGRVREWMERLQSEGIRGADLIFACIGPALEIYSKYSKVVDAEEREIPLGGDPTASEPHKRGFLAYVWETIGRIALEQVLGTNESKATNGAASVLEEDARLTALFLWTLQSTNGTFANGRAQEVDEDDIDEEEETKPKKKTKGFSLVFDVVRRFAQPLGIHLEEWEGRIIETQKGVVRLLSVSERAEQLFGKEGAQAIAEQLESNPSSDMQVMLFPEMDNQPPIVKGRKGRGRSRVTVSDESLSTKYEATTLDRVHAAMLLQKSGRTSALRVLLKSELERGPEFLRLANALSALYPKGSEEKRLIDAMLLAVPK